MLFIPVMGTADSIMRSWIMGKSRVRLCKTGDTTVNMRNPVAKFGPT